jgi:hypothetical protein
MKWAVNAISHFWLPLIITCFFVVVDRYGPAVTHDSLFYMNGAESIRDLGHFSNEYYGAMQHDTHYAPGLSALLASLSFLSKLSVGIMAKSVMYLLLFTNLLLVLRLCLAHRIDQKSTIGFTVIFGLSFPFLSIHLHIWSEPLYLTLLLVVALALKHWFDTNQCSWFFLAVVLLGLSVLVRFAGLFMLPYFGLLILQKRGFSWKWILPFSFFSLLPFVLWSLRNTLLTQELSSRTLFWNWSGGYAVLGAFTTVLFWSGLSFVVLALVVSQLMQRKKLLLQIWPQLVGALVYVAFLLLAKSSVDPMIPLDSRLLSPLLVPMISSIFILWDGMIKSWMKVTFFVALLLSSVQLIRPIQELYQHGWGLNDRRLLEVGIPGQIKTLLPNTAVCYASGFDVHYFRYLLKREVKYLPIDQTLPDSSYFLLWLAEPPNSRMLANAEERIPGLLWVTNP